MTQTVWEVNRHGTASATSKPAACRPRVASGPAAAVWSVLLEFWP